MDHEASARISAAAERDPQGLTASSELDGNDQNYYDHEDDQWCSGGRSVTSVALTRGGQS